ncbi:tail fiber domain-containing protein [Flavobacterium enshiense]|uniref:tail fiber domain-containing protein n=1 Tax=Flavobacterium enshiense TaxID=1341165 RepID=UPI00345CDE11
MKLSTLNVLFISLIAFSLSANAQVGISTTTPQASLDITSTNDGLLIPRISLSATNVATVITPTTSEIVYNTNTSAVGPNQVTPGFYYWNGTLWVRLATGGNTDWTTTGNAGTAAGTNFIGTTDAQDLRFKTNGNNRLNISNTTGQIQSYTAGTATAPAFSWFGDDNTGVYQGGTDVLAFTTGGSEKMKMNTTEAVVNDSQGNFDFRIEGDNTQYALFSDASSDAVIFGSTGTLSQNGLSFNTTNLSPNPSNYSTTIDYVADFDNGLSRGTTMGLGSIEYLVDGEAELFVSDSFSPNVNVTYDLGFAISWDDVYADDFWNVSDIRAKKDITPMKYGLKEIMKLSTISYKLKDDPFQDKKIGLIAQEVNQFVPEASKTEDMKKNEKGEFEKVQLEKIRVSYVNLVPVLIKAVQEQQATIEALEKRLSALEKK